MKRPALSMRMMQMLRDVDRGDYMHPGSPFKCSNTNRTAEGLETRGLIKLADDQTRARGTLCFAWVLTDAGRAYIDA